MKEQCTPINSASCSPTPEPAAYCAKRYTTAEAVAWLAENCDDKFVGDRGKDGHWEMVGGGFVGARYVYSERAQFNIPRLGLPDSIPIRNDWELVKALTK